MRQLAKSIIGRSGVCVVLVFLWLALLPGPAAAQKKKSKDKKPEPASALPADATLPQTDSQQIDQAIGQTLGYWQLGETDSLRKFYSNDVVVVSGLWEPPVVGWDNYARVFQAQRTGVTAVRMDRTNTYIKVNGNSAWATYQWNYSATVEGKFTQFRGHTTLVFSKQADRWLIVLDHSSVVPDAVPPPSDAPKAAAARP